MVLKVTDRDPTTVVVSALLCQGNRARSTGEARQFFASRCSLFTKQKCKS
jgi:hypothetical protein